MASVTGSLSCSRRSPRVGPTLRLPAAPADTEVPAAPRSSVQEDEEHDAGSPVA